MAWKCLGGFCFPCEPEDDPLDCPYTDLADCTANGCANSTYDCLNGDCTFAGLLGFYPTLATCQTACETLPDRVTYNCVADECVDPGDGTGIYNTLFECQSNCGEDAPQSWNCVGGECVDPGDGTGAYTLLAECESFCLFPNPFPIGCDDHSDNEYAFAQRRVGCSSMLAQYTDTEKYIIEHITASCGTTCDDFLTIYADTDRYEIQTLQTNAPCLCVPLPETCAHEATVLHAVVSAPGCVGLDGAEFDMEYDGTECEHSWRGTFTTPAGCILEAVITCGCCTITAEFEFGNNNACPPDHADFDYDCDPLVVTMTHEGCTYGQIPGINCGTCDITVVVTL